MAKDHKKPWYDVSRRDRERFHKFKKFKRFHRFKLFKRFNYSTGSGSVSESVSFLIWPETVRPPRRTQWPLDRHPIDHVQKPWNISLIPISTSIPRPIAIPIPIKIKIMMKCHLLPTSRYMVLRIPLTSGKFFMNCFAHVLHFSEIRFECPPSSRDRRDYGATGEYEIKMGCYEKITDT